MEWVEWWFALHKKERHPARSYEWDPIRKEKISWQIQLN